MRLTHLELRNYRCFEALDLDLDDVTVLVGANDTGKSVVLEAVRLLLGHGPTIPSWPDIIFGRQRHPSRSMSIIGTFGPLGAAQSWFGPTAPREHFRLGISSNLGGTRIVLEADELPALLAALDPKAYLDHFGLDSIDGIEEALVKDGWLVWIEGRAWVDTDIWEFADGLEIWDMLGTTFGMVGPRFGMLSAISLGGPLDTSWSPEAVLEPIIRRAVSRSKGPPARIQGREPGIAPTELPELLVNLGDATAALQDAVDDLVNRVSRSHSAAMAADPTWSTIQWGADLDIGAAVMAALSARASTSEDFTSPNPNLGALGPGTRRTLALSALQLYRDPELWPAYEDRFGLPALAILLVEEPETGLHPSAQRALARSLRSWATYGLQIVLVTHSPSFVNAAPPSGLRLARRAGDGEARTVVRPYDLDEVRRELGVQPSDVLLARRFVVVEGETERAVLVIWARRLGFDLRAEGVELVVAHGSGYAHQVARFLDLAYDGADFVVVLDNGRDTANQKLEIDARFGDRVSTILLSRNAIEGFYHEDAIIGWLRLTGADAEGLEHDVERALVAGPDHVRALRNLAERHLHRPYDKVNDGRSIANLTREEHIDPDIKGLLTRIAS